MMEDNGEISENFVDAGQNFFDGEGLDESQMQHEGGSGDEEVLREQDRFLPIANVARIMKNSVPKNGKIAKDAKECVQECVSEFISFITSEASERCHQEKRKTINGEDILFAMSVLGFDNYVEPLKQYLQKYRESIKGDKAEGGESEGFSESKLTLSDVPGSQSTIIFHTPSTSVNQYF